MRALSASPGSPHGAIRRVSKPVMEKRRRERINYNLETLRLLMLENTNDEKLKNPKVEKAEILESVVHFLKSEKDAQRSPRVVKRLPHRDHRPTAGTDRRGFQDGVRSCLLRVSHFVSSNSPESGAPGEDVVQATFTHAQHRTRASSPGLTHGAHGPAPSRAPASPSPHLPLSALEAGFSSCPVTGFHCDTRKLLRSPSSGAHGTEPVWRPWPQ